MTHSSQPPSTGTEQGQQSGTTYATSEAGKPGRREPVAPDELESTKHDAGYRDRPTDDGTHGDGASEQAEAAPPRGG
jgi:hypothetical protein